MSKTSSNRAAQPKNLWTPIRVGLIGSALVLVAAIAVAFFRSNIEAPKLAANAPGKPSPSAVPVAAASGASNTTTRVRAPAKVLAASFPTLAGKPQRLADYADKIIVVDIWATWCGPCRREIPHLVELAREFKGRGVEVIGLTTEDPAKDTEKVREFVKEFKINYPIGFANGEFALDLMQGRDIIPQTYVIGRDGKVRLHLVGFNDQTGPPQLRAALEEAVAGEK